MNKTTLMAVALATCLGYVPAGAAEVVSSNIVGYQKVALDPGYNMIGVQFVDVGTGEAKSLTTVAALDSTMDGFDEEGTFATQLKVWRNGDYTTYGWSGTSGTDVLDDSSLDNKWLNRDLEEDTTASLDAQDAVWIKAGSSGTILVSGQVPTNDVVVPLAAGYNMVANPFPKTVKVSDFGMLSSNMEGFDEEGTFATQLKVWKDGDYTTYGWSGTSGTDVLDDPSLDNKWLNRDLEETNDTVDFGHGVWIKAGSSGTITFSAK
ncbi:MAG: hypothetical protein IJK04_10820 [Kiritimatiellae bacterium]|nr:hypothetical protein [Kiritimatiellia bacterium]